MDTPKKTPLQSIGLAEPTSSNRLDGALLVGACLIAVIRLRGEDLRPSPRVTSIIADSVRLARSVLREIQRL